MNMWLKLIFDLNWTKKVTFLITFWMFDKQGHNYFETGVFWQEKEDSPAIEIFNFVVANNVSHTITPHPLFFVKKLHNCSYLLINIANIYEI